MSTNDTSTQRQIAFGAAANITGAIECLKDDLITATAAESIIVNSLIRDASELRDRMIELCKAAKFDREEM